MATEPTKRAKPKVVRRRNKAPDAVLKALVPTSSNPVLDMAKANGQQIDMDDCDRFGRYIYYVTTPAEDGRWRTKREAASLAGYSEVTTVTQIEKTAKFKQRMVDYVNAWPVGDVRANCVTAANDIVQKAADPKDRIAAARYLTEVTGDFAPKQVESKSISLKARLPHR